MSYPFRLSSSLLVSTALVLSLAHHADAQNYIAPSVQFGPSPITDTTNNGNGVGLVGGNSAGGAATSIVADPATAANIWIGTANGGVWRSTNGGASFAPLTDKQSSLSIGALALDPTSAAHARTLVAGFGNLSSAGGAGGALNGLIVSRDNGSNWTPLASAGLAGVSVGGLIANGSTVIAASPDANGGVFVSSTGGARFSRVTSLNGAVTGLAADPSSPGRIYAAVVPNNRAQARVAMSPDNGKSWTTVFSADQVGSRIGLSTTTLRIAVGPTGALAVAVVNNIAGSVASDPGPKAASIFLSASPSKGGFNALALPSAKTSGGASFGLNPGGQGSTNLAISIDPTNPNIVYVSGDRQALSATGEPQDPNDATNQLPNSIGAKEYTATVYKIVLRPDGSSLFQPITNNFAGDGGAPHADTRAMAFTVTGQLLLGTDGGLYSRSSPNSPSGAWSGLNTGLGAIESYKAAFDPRSGLIFVAAQDNGVASQTAPGRTAFNNISTGDGFNAAVDAWTLAASNQSIAYVGTNNLSLQRIVLDASGTGVRLNTLSLMVRPQTGPAIALAAYELPSPAGVGTDDVLPLSSLFALNRIDPTLAVFGTRRVYTARLDPALFGDAVRGVNVTLTDILGQGGDSVSALAYGARDNTGALVAAAGGTVYVSTSATPAAGTLNTTQGAFGGNINQLAFDPENSSRFYAANGKTIMGTSNSGQTTVNLFGNLPTTFQNVNAVEFISNNGVRALFAGGSNAVANARSPVYVSLDGALTGWSPFSTGLPNALVNQLTYTPDADFLLVTTLGRGAWGVDDVTSYFPTATRLQFGFASGNDSRPVAAQLTDGTDPSGNSFSRALVKQGAGTLTLNVRATYSGPTTISAGTMMAGAANVFAPVSDHTVAAGATVNLASFSQTIGSLAGAGAVTLGTGTLTTGGSGASTTFSGVISGAGGLVKAGAGVFTLNGASTYTGGTSVNLGTLALPAGSVLASNVVVQSGATFATAPGAVGTAPAQVAGLVTVPGSTLSITPSAGSRPSIASSGPVVLGGTLVVTPQPADETPGTVLPLITGSSVTDNRALVVNGGGPLRPVADPLPGVFAVMLVRGERDLAKGPIQMAVASIIDADVAAGRDAALELSVATDTVQAQGGDLRSLSGIGLTAYETAAVAGAQRFQTNIAAHVAGMDLGGSPARQLAMAAGAVRGGTAGGPLDPALLIAASAYAPASLAADSNARGRLWIEGSGAFGNLSASGDAPGVHTSGGGVVIGADTVIRPGTLAGIAVAYDTTSLGSEGLRPGAKVDAYRLSAYGRTSLGDGGSWLGGSIDYSRGIGRGGRRLAVGLSGPDPLVGVTTAKPDGNAVAGQVQLGQRLAVAGFDIVPTAAIQVLHYDQDAFVEGGGSGAELAVGGRSRSGARTVIGAALSRVLALPNGMSVTPAASLGWAHQFADRGAVLNAAFVSGGGTFRLDGTVPGRDAALLGASATLQAGERLAVFLGYDAALARRETSQSVTGGLRMTW